MKKTSLFLVLVVVFGMARAWKTTPTAAIENTGKINPACLTKNKFLADLKVTEPCVGIFTNVLMPQAPNSFKCGAEWNTFGTCCNSTHLENLYKFEADIIDRNKMMTSIGLGILNGKINAWNTSDPFKAQALEMNKKVLATTEVCWNYVKKIRGSALCSICSGRSEKYFSASKDKILVDPTTCRTSVDSCEVFFNAYTWLRKNFKNLTQKLGLATSKEADEKTLYDAMKKAVEDYSPPQYLLDAFAEYDQHKNDTVRLGIHSAKLCSMFLNVRNRPFYWGDFGKPQNSTCSRNLGLLGLKAAFSRSLDSQNEKEPFSSDSLVLISSSDSMYSSYAGSPGTLIDSSGNVQPMNASLIFP